MRASDGNFSAVGCAFFLLVERGFAIVESDFAPVQEALMLLFEKNLIFLKNNCSKICRVQK